MKNKKQQILASAKAMFASKGFNATTIQDIAEHAGIAKGGLYFYFKSKDDLLFSIYKDYYEHTFQDLAPPQLESKSPGELLREHLLKQYSQVEEHRTFLMMQLKEQAMQTNEELMKYLHRMKLSYYEHLRELILRVYGEELRKHSYDLTLSLRGMLREYMVMLLNGEGELPAERIVQYAIGRLDEMAKGLKVSKEEPVITESIVQRLKACHGIVDETDKISSAAKAVRQMRELLQGKSPAESVNKALQALQMLEDELNEHEPRSIVMEGMVAVLEGRLGDFPELRLEHVKLALKAAGFLQES